ncbi:MAG: ATP-binding cassette domain-containing protein [Fimbriimonadaceae bacterium]|nr:ATP-binding cassette domain-containing protein [Fimbriimonadaceae bacterium]
MTPAVQMSGITKRFGSVTALDSVDFRAEFGTIQALVGENGAGKTTLMKVLYGSHPQDAGTLLVRGEPTRFQRSADAIRLKIGMVSQHYAVIPELTNLQNLILGAEGGEWLGLAAAEARAGELARRMGFEFDWKAPSSELSPAGAQKLEILKLLWREAQIMILDEPTAMLSPADGDALYASLGRLAADGACVIVVTHRLPEVLDHASHVTVLRAGRLVASRPVPGLTEGELAEMIVGHGVEPPVLDRPVLGEVRLRRQQATILGDRRNEAVKQADLEIRAGEIVGIAGVDGSGQRELVQAAAGLRPAASGAISILGKGSAATADLLASGLRIIPEDRLSEGVIEDWTLEENAVLGLQRNERFRKGPWLRLAERPGLARQTAEVFRTRHGGTRSQMRGLSGGNQQRFVAGRALATDPRLVLAFQPARGLDIDGTDAVYAEIRRRCREGQAAALVVSFDLDELLTHCDRIAVMYGGRLAFPPADQARDRAALGRMMVGGEP